jgi:hypothetical protein
MAETILTLSHALDRAQALRSLATNTLARQAAMKAAKAQLQAQGFRPTHLPRRELTLRAEACLAANREAFVADAQRVVAQWEAEGFFGKRAKLLSDAQGGKA